MSAAERMRKYRARAALLRSLNRAWRNGVAVDEVYAAFAADRDFALAVTRSRDGAGAILSNGRNGDPRYGKVPA